MVTVVLPPLWREHAGERGQVQVEAADVAGMLAALAAAYPGVGRWLFDDRGQVPHYLNIFVNGEDIRILAEFSTPLHPGDEVQIIPAISGGRGGLP